LSKNLELLMNILIATEKNCVSEFLTSHINRELAAKIHIKKNASDSIDFILTERPHIAIIDIDINEMNGIELCETLENESQKTYMMLFSDKDEDYIKIAAYEAGFDDFIKNPSHPKLFRKKLKRISERLTMENGEAKNIRYNNLIIDKSKYIIQHKDISYTLPKKQFLIYSLLCEKPGKVFTREYIYEKVWKEKMDTTNRSVDVHIRGIRMAIPENNILTYRGIGYKVPITND